MVKNPSRRPCPPAVPVGAAKSLRSSGDRFIEKVRGLEARGAVMLGDEMIDEASHTTAQAIVAKGRVAGLPS